MTDFLPVDPKDLAETKAIGRFEVKEPCPWCDAMSQFWFDFSVGHLRAYCPQCGAKLMICSECIVNMNGHCDWRPNGIRGKQCCMDHEDKKEASADGFSESIA